MGGNAFTSGETPLFTPRMPPAVYRHVRDMCHALLQQQFHDVATPVEGPAKKDYGDVDFFLTRPKTSTGHDVADEGVEKDILKRCETLLGAERALYMYEGKKAYFAIPWPQDLPEGTDEEADPKPRHIQVDVEFIKTSEQFKWLLLKHAHGDLWNVLGSVIRPLGLTADEFSLNIRVPEIEKENKNKARVRLSSEPTDVLDFLGLKTENWDELFESTEALFEFVAGCRMFWVRPPTTTTTTSPNASDGEATGGKFDHQNLTARDRHRVKSRPLYDQWINEFIPKCRAEGRFSEPRMNRSQVRDEAFERFGIQQAYEKRLLEFKREKQRITLSKEVIKPALPKVLSHQWLDIANSTFKKIILADNSTFGIKPPRSIKDENGIVNVQEVERFVRTCWREVAVAAWKKQSQKMLEKIAKDLKNPVDPEDHNSRKRTASGNQKENQQATEQATNQVTDQLKEPVKEQEKKA